MDEIQKFNDAYENKEACLEYGVALININFISHQIFSEAEDSVFVKIDVNTLDLFKKLDYVLLVSLDTNKFEKNEIVECLLQKYKFERFKQFLDKFENNMLQNEPSKMIIAIIFQVFFNILRNFSSLSYKIAVKLAFELNIISNTFNLLQNPMFKLDKDPLDKEFLELHESIARYLLSVLDRENFVNFQKYNPLDESLSNVLETFNKNLFEKDGYLDAIESFRREIHSIIESHSTSEEKASHTELTRLRMLFTTYTGIIGLAIKPTLKDWFIQKLNKEHNIKLVDEAHVLYIMLKKAIPENGDNIQYNYTRYYYECSSSRAYMYARDILTMASKTVAAESEAIKISQLEFLKVVFEILENGSNKDRIACEKLICALCDHWLDMDIPFIKVGVLSSLNKIAENSGKLVLKEYLDSIKNKIFKVLNVKESNILIRTLKSFSIPRSDTLYDMNSNSNTHLKVQLSSIDRFSKLPVDKWSDEELLIWLLFNQIQEFGSILRGSNGTILSMLNNFKNISNRAFYKIINNEIDHQSDIIHIKFSKKLRFFQSFNKLFNK